MFVIGPYGPSGGKGLKYNKNLKIAILLVLVAIPNTLGEGAAEGIQKCTLFLQHLASPWPALLPGL